MSDLNKKSSQRKLEKQKELPAQILQTVDEKIEEKVRSLVVEASLFIGPIPEPKTLQQYENVTSGLADRIVTMAEKEQDDRFKENKRRHNRYNAVVRGTYAVIVVGFAMGFYLLAFESPPRREWWYFLLPVLPHLLSQIVGAFKRDRKE